MYFEWKSTLSWKLRRVDDDDDTQGSPSNSRQKLNLTDVSAGILTPR